MKKIFLILTIITIIAVSALSVIASNTVSNIKLDYSVNDNGNIVVSASVVDIKESTGLSGIIYYIDVDTSALQYVNANMNMPTKWEPLVDSDFAECTFFEESNGKYCWFGFIVNSGEGYGIKEDDQLTINIEFKPLKHNSTAVSFECEAVYNDTADSLYNPLKGENGYITIDLSSTNVPSVEASSEDSVPSIEDSSEEISDVQTSSEESTAVEDITNSEASVDNSESVSMEDSKTENDQEYSEIESSEIVSSEDDVSSDFIESFESDEGSIVSVGNTTSADDDSIDDANDNESKTNVVIWIIIGVLGVAAIITIVFIVLQKNKK